MRLYGREAIEWKRKRGGCLNKYTDPTEGAREDITVDFAEEVSSEDPGLIWIEVEDKTYHAVALGSMTSPKKAAAVRENGRKGGRPMKRYGLYVDGQPSHERMDVMAATPQSAARKLALPDWFERDGRVFWDDKGRHYEVIPEERW